MNPSERFHPSPLGFCEDKRRGESRATLLEGTSQSLRHAVKSSAFVAFSLCEHKATLHFLSLHLRICVCGRLPFVPACAIIQVLLMSKSGV